MILLLPGLVKRGIWLPLKILVDENLPLRLASFLRSQGVEALDVREAGLRGATDEKILAWAKEQGFMILTEDLGFGSVIRLSENHPGVIVVRGCSNLSIKGLFEAILKCLKIIRDRALVGKIFVCEPGRVRINVQ